MNKLDYLAQKEEELRKLNDQLDARRTDFTKKAETPKIDSEAQEEGDNYSDDEDKFPEEKMNQKDPEPIVEQSKQPDLFAGGGWSMKPKDQEAPEEQDNGETGEEFLKHRNTEQTKLINIQKAKIQAIQSELEDALKKLTMQEIQIDDKQENEKKISQEEKKQKEKISTQDIQIQKLKTQNQDLTKRLSQFDNQLKEQNKEIDQVEREKKKTQLDVGSKDAKLNRALEEIEKYKQQLRESRMSDLGKNDSTRREMEKLVQDNRKLERERNELLQAFKKQMKLIDVIKRQKMHIESAKLLAFTEDEFVQTLELGEKV